MTGEIGDWLTGAVDLHVHGAPDLVPRRYSDLELARLARAAGMRAIVLKSHVESTVGRAALATEATRFPVYGGIVLNPFVTGGLDPDAVEVSLALGARIVWLPSLASEAHRAAFGRRGSRWTGLRRHPAQIPATAQVEPVSPADGTTRAALRAICHRVARSDALLASGHVGRRAVIAVADLASRAGTRFLVTHPDYAVPGLTLAEQVAFAEAFPGLVLERTAFVTAPAWPGRRRTADLVAAIRATGIERNVLTSDLGQPANPPYPDGLAAFAASMVTAGLEARDVRRMLVDTPAALVGA